MPLSPGARLGSYEITGTIGAGGMGDVYRARDTKLDRVVAIKVLPDAFAADADRLSRFEREARTLASLNHPNIAQVFGVTESPVALVMELVDGEDLAARISRGPVPLDEAIAIGRQIADALEAAHEQGIVHRDLKPANIKIRPDGAVKVLDFGLAKALPGAGAGGSAAGAVNSPTFTSPALTELGMILGTAAYMAPEQARGKPIDRRADIWAFGCVLSEMLTGKSPFGGEDVSLTLAAILKDDVDFSRLPSDTPASVRRLLRRCLEKDVRKRLSSIADARLDLDEESPPAAETVPPRSRWRIAAYAFGGFVAFVGGATAISLVSTRSPARSADRPDFSLRRLTDLPGPEIDPSISPDGKQVLFSSRASGRWAVYLLRVGGRAINLTANSQADDRQARFSPDGERIAFRSERDGGGIFVMGATGESVRRVTTAGYDPAWSPDGRSIAYATEGILDPYARNTKSELWVADVATGQATRIFAGDGVQPAWSPDGRRIAFWANAGGQRDLWTIPAGGGTPVAITKDLATDWSPEWSPDGRWLYFSSDRGGHMNLWRVAVDAGGAPTAEPQAVTRSMTGVGFARMAAGGSRVSVMAYSRTYELSMGEFDMGTGRLGALTTVRSPSLGWCRPSSAGAWLACTSRGAQEDIVLMRSDGSETIRLTDDPAKDRNSTWSPDGSRIAFMSTRSGQWEIWSVRRDGSDLRQMTDLRADVYDGIWSPDGKRVATGSTTRAPYGTWLFDPAVMATPASARFFKHDASAPFAVEVWSPDGTRAAGSVLGPDGLPRAPAVMDMATGVVTRFDVPVPPNIQFYLVAGWFPDSRRFLTAGPDGLIVVDTATGHWTPVSGPAGGSGNRLSGDGRHLLVEREVLDADIWLLEQKR